MYEPAGRFQVTRGRLPPGDAGIRVTLEHMRRLAHEGAGQPLVRELAIRILHRAGAAAHDQRAELGALFAFVRDCIRFVRDPLGIETIQSPRYTLRIKAGDCDDRATLLAALARAIGIATRFRVIGADPGNPRRFSHVYLVARVDGRDLAMDPTYHGNQLGWEHPQPYRRAEVMA